MGIFLTGFFGGSEKVRWGPIERQYFGILEDVEGSLRDCFGMLQDRWPYDAQLYRSLGR